MPLYYFECSTCGVNRNRILTPVAAKEVQICKACASVLHRTPKGGSVQTMEVLDNGNLVKPVTRYADAEKLYKDRSRAASTDDDL